jgi:acetyl esterase/lipase
VRRGAALPPVLLVSAEQDLDYIAEHTPAMARHFVEQGVDCEQVRVPGAGHFYPRSAAALDAMNAPTTVGAAVDRFLDRTLRHGGQR